MKRLSISSFSYRYNIGFEGFRPPRPLTAEDLLRRTKSLGFAGAQLCENLGIARMTAAELDRVASLARELGLFLEVGMNGAEEESLLSHLRIAQILNADTVRVVLGGASCKKPAEIEDAKGRFINLVQSVLPAYKTAGVKIGIENHFDLPPAALRQIVDYFDDDSLQLILDTTNSIHFLLRPEEVLGAFRGRILSVHLKDYRVRQAEAGHWISGAVLGEGELDLPLFVNCCDNIALEMTTRRPCGSATEQILAWEDEAVAASAAALLKYCGG